MANLISTQLSAQVIKFQPGGSPAFFEVTVTNESDRFATFLVELSAAGAEVIPGWRWYSLSPNVGAKKPPGDTTQFTAMITDTPVPGFAGIMNLTVRIFSLELREEIREVVRLIVEQGKELRPVKVNLPIRDFQSYPDDLVEIPVNVSNPNQSSTNVVLSFLGVDPKWLVEGDRRQLEIVPGGKAETSFLCKLPIPTKVKSQAYPFTIEATQAKGFPSSTTGGLMVLPKGFVEFSCIPTEQQIPKSRWWLPNWKSKAAIYTLRFENASNLSSPVGVEVKEEPGQPKCSLQVIPETAELTPGETTELQLVVKKRRRWWGLNQKLLLKVKAFNIQTNLDIQNDTQILKLLVLPVTPIWLQVLTVMGLLVLAWWLSWLNPNNHWFGHHAAVNSVQFDGLGNMIMSGSDDQRIIAWNSQGFLNPLSNPYVDEIENIGKAVRVIRYRPVDHNMVAVGLENGQIQLWNIQVGAETLVDSFFFKKEDRVLALEFTQDSRYLFSGHGSGLVLKWDIQSELAGTSKGNNSLLKAKPFNFAVYALALVGKANNNLIIGGRFNQLQVWNLVTDKIRRLPYHKGGQDDYIQSVAVASYRPNLMATADNQGFITLWNLDQCLSKDVNCAIVDQWSNSHNGKPVRSVALTRDGCYLASGGDDGRVMLWPLKAGGRRNTQFVSGILIRRSSHPFKSVDVRQLGKNVLVVSGNDDDRVRLDKFPKINTECKATR